MKPYTSLANAKKSLLIQVLALTAAALLFAMTGRIMVKNQLPLSMILSYDLSQLKTADNITIKWEKEGIDVTEYNVEQASEDSLHAKVLQVTMHPEKAGKYVMKVLDSKGKELLKDEIFVDRFRTAFSKRTGSFTGEDTLMLAFILYYLGLAVIMLVFFNRLKGSLAYSYEAILSCGVFIFSVVTLIINVPVYINHLKNPGIYSTWQFINDVAAGGKYFTIFTSPLIFVFCILLIISNIELLQHEKVQFQNILGLLLGFSLMAGILLYISVFTHIYLGSPNQQFAAAAIENIIGITFTYVECILFATMICGFLAAMHVPGFDRDYILILGCGFRKDGSLPPLLKGRVDKAMEFWYKQKNETGKEAVVIPSGGQGKGEPMAESQAMYRYLVGNGFPEESIIREEKSTNTYQNMEFSKKIIEERSPDMTKVNTAFVTTNYHVFRSGVWAGLAGLTAEGLGSRTRWWYWPNAFLRECAGLLRNRLIPETAGLAVLIICFAIVTRLAYL